LEKFFFSKSNNNTSTESIVKTSNAVAADLNKTVFYGFDGKEPLTLALVKVAQPGDFVVALHVLGTNDN
jgi:hypothetical protein